MLARNGPPLPRGWSRLTFGDCAEFINGRAYAQDELLEAGTPVLRIQNLTGGDRWYYSNLKLPAEKYCEDGDLLFAWSASFGPYIWKGPKCIFHYHIWRVIPHENLDKQFAYYLLAQLTRELKSSARGIAMLHLTKSGIEAHQISLPPPDEQRRIAAILGQADELRRKRRQALERVSTLSLSIFFEMFGDPSVSSIDWPTTELGAVSTFENGDRSSNYPSGDDIQESGILFLSTRNIVNDTLDLSVRSYISPAKFATLSGGKARPHDLLITLRGTLGSCCIFDGEVQDAFINAQMMIIRAGTNILPRFLHSFITLPSVKTHLLRIGSGAAVRQLTASQLSKLVLPLPPLDLQKTFVARVAEIDKLKASHGAHLAKLDALFASLQHRAFRGEL